MARFFLNFMVACSNGLKRSKPRNPILLLVITAITGACVTQLELNVSSPYFNAYAGSKLTLLKPIQIPPETASVYIQDGETKSYRAVDSYRAYCVFEVNTRREVAQTIEPDEFAVVRYRRDFEQVNSGAIVPVATLSLSGEMSNPMATVYSSELYLKSDKQPDVLRMTCSHWDDPETGNYLTVAEIKQTLNGLMTLQLPKLSATGKAT